MPVFHIVNAFDSKNSEEAQRNSYACLTRQFLEEQDTKGDYTVIEVVDRELPRSSAKLKDPRPRPFVKDIINKGISKIPKELRTDKTIIVLTNYDICVSKSFIKQVKKHMSKPRTPACYSVRHELVDILPIADQHRDDIRDYDWLTPAEIRQIRKAQHCADTFVFTLKWWRENKNKIPDFVIGYQWWDVAFLDQISATSKNPELKYATYHIKHESFWQSATFTNPGQINNFSKIKKWKTPFKKSWLPKAINYYEQLRTRRPNIIYKNKVTKTTIYM